MYAFWEIVASNSLVVGLLAVGVVVLGCIWRNPAALHLLWVLVLLKLVTPPMVVFPIPMPTAPESLASEQREVSRSTTYAAPVEAPALVEGAGKDASVAKTSSPRRLLEEPASVESAEPNRPLAISGTKSPTPTWPAVLAAIWGLGIIVFAFRQAYRILRFRRLLYAAVTAPPALLTMAERIGDRLGLRRIPEVRMLPARTSPMVWWLGGRARVILPVELFQQLDGNAREAILAHELAHVRRKDHWVRVLELVIATLFWWHPAVWWACQRLQELEDQCCDAMVLGLAPHGAQAYATALVDTLEFLSDRSLAAPLGATAAQPFVSLVRRIAMLKNRTCIVRLTFGRLLMLAAVAALPMVAGFAAERQKTDGQPPPDDQKPVEKPAVQRRVVNRLVTDFPEKVDLSTPESAQAAWNRASAKNDDQAVLALSWVKWGPRDIEQMERQRKGNPKETEIYSEAQRNSEILEVATYRGDLADVVTKLKFPEGVGRDPYSSRSFGKINGLWKNLGEDRLPNLEAARDNFDNKKDGLWRNFVSVREDVKSGRTAAVASRQKRAAQIAPGEPLGISVEKADLMGRVEWSFMHGARDITARKTIEWGEIQKDEKGNRSLRYKFYATIWDREVLVMNVVFTFDAKGNILDMVDVEGFPQKKIVKPADVSTQAGMKELVEDFFTKNFRDITARETVEWGDVTKEENGNSSIRYKYRATIWDKDTMIMNQIFTFDPKGQYVSFKNVDGFPQKP